MVHKLLHSFLTWGVQSPYFHKVSETDNRKKGKLMNRTDKEILNLHKLRLIHYCKKGIGTYSDLSKNTLITPTLIKNTLETYLSKGGDSDFSDITDEKYRQFLVEMKG